MNKLPLVSIIIPCRNEEKFIGKCLDSIIGNDYPKDKLEIFIADGMSTDNTRGIIQSLQVKHHNIKLIDNPGKIVSTGMNAAILQSRGEIIIRVDGHCEIDREYVKQCVEHLSTEDIDGVGGPWDTIGEAPLAKVIAAAMSSPFGVGNSAFRTLSNKTMLVDTVPFPAYTRAAINKAGLYDEELVRDQDDEYNYRLRKMGGKILLAADIRSKYYSRSSLKSLWRQYFQYGYWKVRVCQKHPQQMRLRQFVPAAFICALLGSMLLGFFMPLGWCFLAFVAGVYILTNIGACLLMAVFKGWRLLPRLPIVYAILHLSYGMGFLCGLFAFARRWRDKIGKVPELERGDV